jgi:hypothetical protein
VRDTVGMVRNSVFIRKQARRCHKRISLKTAARQETIQRCKAIMESQTPGNEHEERIALAMLLKDLYQRAVRDGKLRTAAHLREALELMLKKTNRGNEK